MTDRLYYTDPELLEFEGTLLAVENPKEGVYQSVLDRSAFYPTSGGQSHDLGQLGGAEIIEVKEDSQGDIVHVTANPPGEVGEKIKGLVQYEHRMKNRQLHTAQHLLSQIFFRLIDAVTVSVHLGEEYGAIEFDVDSISENVLAEAERMVNRVVIDSMPVEILFVESSEIGTLGLRREPKRSGKLRIIRIGEFEATACGGTHCTHTGQVQLVKLIGIETIRKRTLVKFLAGAQAFNDYVARFDVTTKITKALTSGLIDLPDKCDKLVEEIKALKRDLTAARKELIPSMVNDLLDQKIMLKGIPALLTTLPEEKIELGQPLAIELASKLNGLALLVIGTRIIIACAESSNAKAGQLMRALSQHSPIKGGGSDVLAQGAGASSNELDHYRQLLTEGLG